MKSVFRRDPWIAGFAVLLVVGGFFALASASLGLISSGGSPLGILARQFAQGAVGGGIALLIVERLPLRLIQKNAFWIFAASFVLSLAVFIPALGFASGGATRWIAWGPIFLQPSEFLKIGFVVYLAAWLSSRRFEVRSFEFGALPLLAMILVLGVLFAFEPDIGTFGVIVFTGFLLFYAGGGRLRHLGAMGLVLLMVLAGIVAWKPYVLDRIMVFVNPSYDPQGAGYQVRQAAIAFGSGGAWGKGFGQGEQKFHYLPEPMGDAVFAVVGEEFGFAGATALVALFLAFLWRMILVVRRVSDPFARLLGAGIGILITVQAFINMGALVGILPLTGITLPFISQGGSSLAATLMGVGLLLNISKQR